ncbi:DUF6185 family protein [Streptomyces cadmiisoli]|uniref:DUF6185 family protein n=1 Tax=Streptomyces cadmiisoli TaxID=2184053 RepID=UPI0013A6BF30|nr:DUF6185 family protein [Streptomyces cadmiisoli]
MRTLWSARLAVLIGLLALLVLPETGMSAVAWGAEQDNCHSLPLKDAKVTTSVRLEHDGQDYTRAETDLVVQVPKAWKPAADLLLNGDTEQYRAAMRCVLRYPDELYPYRDTEWRPWPPKVTVQKKWITVEHRAVTYVDDLRDRDFGTWRISAGRRYWTLTLVHPPALGTAWWQEITVDLGGRAARSMTPVPTKGSDTKVIWTRAKAGGEPPQVEVRIQPPATKAMIARWNEAPWYLVRSGIWLSWETPLLPVLLLLVRRLSRAPATSLATPAEDATRRNLLIWAWVWFAGALVFELDDQLPSIAQDYEVFTWWPDYRALIHFGLAVCGGAALCLFGRPRWYAMLAVGVATAYTGFFVGLPGQLGQPEHLWLFTEDVTTIEHLQVTGQFLWLALACVCVAFVWLVGFLSVLQRLRAARHIQVADEPQRGYFPWWGLVLCAVAATAVVALCVWAQHNTFEDQSWLSRADDSYDRWHFVTLYDELVWFPSNWPDWFPGTICWWYGGIFALLSVLSARAAAPGGSPLSPDRPELLVITVYFVLSVAPIPGWYVGLSFLLLSAALVLLTGLFLRVVGERRSVLSRKLENGTPLSEVIRESDRHWLFDSARKYRDLHSQLRRLEQGDQDAKREELEEQLDQLHRWNPDDTAGPHAGERLPDSVDAVELALAWGPRDTWWHNGQRAALLAALFALPATGVSFWADNVRGPLWRDVANSEFGVIGLVDHVITSEFIWAGAGFVLGALWRVLPGRRGPAKAVGLSVVFATPVVAHWIISTAVGQPIGTLALHVALTLLVLTSTGVAMDIDTFRQEGHYWPTKAALLLSIYQLRTASVQLAFFVAQVVALVGVWQQLKGNDPMVLIQPEDQIGRSNAEPPGDDTAP